MCAGQRSDHFFAGAGFAGTAGEAFAGAGFAAAGAVGFVVAGFGGRILPVAVSTVPISQRSSG